MRDSWNFFRFLDAVCSRDLRKQADTPVVEKFFLYVRQGITFDPLDIPKTLEQFMQPNLDLQRDCIQMSKEQLSVLDNFTLQHLKFKNCSSRIKTIVTLHKTFIGLPKEGSYPFFFLRSICRKVNDIIDQSEELLDWLDINAFAKLKRPSNFVPHGDSLTPS
jgi:hypothetical protein